MDVADFFWHLRARLKFGEYSRSPLRLLRFELKEDKAECEWLARPNDPWDEGLAANVRQRNETVQALADALRIREALFKAIPEVRSARMRVYRQQHGAGPELIITGSVSREDQVPPRVASLAMRAMLYGFQFRLEDGELSVLDWKPDAFEFAREMSCH